MQLKEITEQVGTILTDCVERKFTGVVTVQLIWKSGGVSAAEVTTRQNFAHLPAPGNGKTEKIG